jgi:uncharacterized protein YerC
MDKLSKIALLLRQDLVYGEEYISLSNLYDKVRGGGEHSDILYEVGVRQLTKSEIQKLKEDIFKPEPIVDRETIIKEHLDKGYKLAKISALTGYTVPQISWVKKKCGYRQAQKLERDDFIKKVLELRKQGLTYLQIRQLVGTSERSIARVVKKYS